MLVMTSVVRLWVVCVRVVHARVCRTGESLAGKECGPHGIVCAYVRVYVCVRGLDVWVFVCVRRACVSVLCACVRV